MNKLALIDRDGTLIVDKHYLSDPDQVELIKGIPAALKKLENSGYKIIVVTNQSGIGRGYFSQGDMEAVNVKMIQLLKNEDAKVDAIYFCPHSPDDNCQCRKPGLGMVEEAMRDFDGDRSKSITIGDKCADVRLGQDMGGIGILVKTGYGEKTIQKNDCKPDFILDSLTDIQQFLDQL